MKQFEWLFYYQVNQSRVCNITDKDKAGFIRRAGEFKPSADHSFLDLLLLSLLMLFKIIY